MSHFIALVPSCFRRWAIPPSEESTLEVDSLVPLMHHDPKDLGLICLVGKRKIHFRILSDLRLQSWILLKKRILINVDIGRIYGGRERERKKQPTFVGSLN